MPGEQAESGKERGEARISCFSMEMFATPEEIAAKASVTKDRDPCTNYMCTACAGHMTLISKEASDEAGR
ncbi:MAG: hypothetical protein KKE20_05530 [Nanoarchaeota archaeon]|nr:hypothetical protein [Nanoarchaeota archaeon]